MDAFMSGDNMVIAAVIFAAISEIIGMTPLKSNSVVQLAINVLGMLFGRKK
jgi:hypothetical protein